MVLVDLVPAILLVELMCKSNWKRMGGLVRSIIIILVFSILFMNLIIRMLDSKMLYTSVLFPNILCVYLDGTIKK